MKAILLAVLVLITCSNAFAGTLAHYRFEEGSSGAIVVGATDDTGVAAHDGVAIGPAVWYSSNVPPVSELATNSSSAFFDGSYGQSILFGFEFPLHLPGDVTLEFFISIDHGWHTAILWTRPDTADFNRFNIFTTHPGTSMSFGFDYVSVTGALHPIANPIAFSLDSDTWTHIAVVRSGHLHTWYRDGVYQGSRLDGTPDLPASGGWQLSGRNGANFRGYIDEVRISDSALTPDEFLYVAPPPTALFSTATTQTIFNDGVKTVHDGVIWSTPLDDSGGPVAIERAIDSFLPRTVGLDALQDMRPISAGVVFSTARSGWITDLQLHHDRAYYYDLVTGEIRRYEPLSGLSVGSLDGLAALASGALGGGAPSPESSPVDPYPYVPVVWAFSTARVEFLLQDDAVLRLFPGNIYAYDRLLDRVSLLVDSGAHGVRDIDALDGSGRLVRLPSDETVSTIPPIVFSTARNEFVVSESGLTRLFQNDTYLLGDGDETTLDAVEYFDGTRRGLVDLDAFSAQLPASPDCPCFSLDDLVAVMQQPQWCQRGLNDWTTLRTRATGGPEIWIAETFSDTRTCWYGNVSDGVPIVVHSWLGPEEFEACQSLLWGWQD